MRIKLTIIFTILTSLLLYPNYAFSQEQASNIQAILAKVPGTKSIFVKLPDGTAIDVNGDSSVPAFSAIKLWIAAATLQASENGSINLGEDYLMQAQDKVGGTGFISPGSTYTLDQLLEFMLTHSDNSASNILINKVGGLGTVDNYIKTSGYRNTTLRRYLALSGPENLTSARDATTFMEMLYEKRIVSESASNKLIGILQKRTLQKNDALYLSRSLPADADFIGKSGIGPRTRNDAGSFVDQARGRIFMSVLISEVTNESLAENVIAELGQYFYNNSKPADGSDSTTSGTNKSTFCTKVGTPTVPSPCQSQGESGIANPTANSIVEWDQKIVQALNVGIWGYLNKMTTAITNGTYSTGTWAGTSEGTVYWCTYSIIDSYNLAGKSGLAKSQHAAVVNMRKFWKGPALSQGYKYVDYQSNPENVVAVKPGDAMMMETRDGVHTGKEHVALVAEISVDQRGNGEIITLDSNSSTRSHKYPIKGWQIVGIPYPVRGFGGI